MADTYRTIPNERPEYFIKKDEKFYWKSEEARIEFYEKMNSDIETMPEQIQTLYETYKLILETLTIE